MKSSKFFKFYNLLNNSIIMIKPIFLSTLLLFQLLSIQTAANQQVWVDFQTKIPLKDFNNGTFGVSIPCHARIGDCRIKYSLLPPNWIETNQFSLLVPSSDVNRIGGFTIKASISNMLGQQKEIDIMALIQNNQISIADRMQFLKKTGYQPRPTYIRPLTFRKTTISQQNIIIQNFPPIQEIKSLINNGNNYLISSRLKQITEKYAPCQSKLSYLKQIQELLIKKILQNQSRIQKSKLQFNSLNFQIKQLEDEKSNAQSLLKSDSSLNDLEEKIRSLNKQRAQLQVSLSKDSFLAERYLENLNSLVNDIQTVQRETRPSQQQLQIIKLEEEVKKIQEEILKAIQKKNALQQEIKNKKANLPTKQNNTNKLPEANLTELMTTYQTKYRFYNQKTIEEKLRIRDIEQSLIPLQTKQKNKLAPVDNIQTKLKDLKEQLSQKTTPQYVLSQQQQINNNQILKLSSANLQEQINLLTRSQCGY